MKRQSLIAMYVGAWIAITAAVIYFARAFGAPWWQALVAAWLLFVVGNGSLAYGSARRRFEAEGKRPPPYLMYLFFPAGIHQSIAVPRALRVVVGLVILAGGAVFAVGAVVLGVQLFGQTQAPGALPLLLLSAVMGAAFAYVGFRLVVMRGDEPLVKRSPARSTPQGGT